MKKKLITLFISAVFYCQNSVAGIPVTVIADVPTQLNQIQNFAQMLKDYAMMVDQLNQMKQQFSQMEKDYKSVTGSRNLGDILNSPEFKQYLPDDWQDIYSNIRNNGYDGLSGAAKALRDASKVFDSCSYINDATEKRICEAQSIQAAQDQTFANDAYKKSTGRVQQIESLMTEINRTSDPKAIAELSARIQAEQALIQNEQTKLAMYQESSKAEKQLLEQQAMEVMSKRLNNHNYVSVEPMEFN
jgi:type IV secretion system protein VirB5